MNSDGIEQPLHHITFQVSSSLLKCIKRTGYQNLPTLDKAPHPTLYYECQIAQILFNYITCIIYQLKYIIHQLFVLSTNFLYYPPTYLYYPPTRMYYLPKSVLSTDSNVLSTNYMYYPPTRMYYPPTRMYYPPTPVTQISQCWVCWSRLMFKLILELADRSFKNT